MVTYRHTFIIGKLIAQTAECRQTSHNYFHSPSYSLSALLNPHSRMRRSLLRWYPTTVAGLLLIANLCISLTWDVMKNKQKHSINNKQVSAAPYIGALCQVEEVLRPTLRQLCDNRSHNNAFPCASHIQPIGSFKGSPNRTSIPGPQHQKT